MEVDNEIIKVKANAVKRKTILNISDKIIFLNNIVFLNGVDYISITENGDINTFKLRYRNKIVYEVSEEMVDKLRLLILRIKTNIELLK